ncbi:CLE06 protein [Senna tora]|uniref:CLE06 protein n=1 Tax=Senna tora TaxID=362788 RepID=A0A834WH35_9FABA|nr:CLE06 protein [Senna tora]
MVLSERKKQQMMGWIVVMLLVLLSTSTTPWPWPCLAAKSTSFHKLKHPNSAPSSALFANEDNNIIGDGDHIFGQDKRKIHTGPNPLHN